MSELTKEMIMMDYIAEGMEIHYGNKIKQLKTKLAQRDEAIKVMREALENIHDTECAGCNLSEVLSTCSNALSKAEQILGGKSE